MYKEQIRGYIAEHGESQTSMAKKIGISGAALSQYLSGNYPNPTSLEVKIKEFFAMAQSFATVIKKPDFVGTSITSTVMDVIGYCHVQKSMGIVYGDAGIGKTMAICRYEQEHTEAIPIMTAFALSKPMSFLKSLARKLRLPDVRRQDDLYTDIIEKLKGSEKVLVIDEAQHLPHSTLEIIRGIHDDAEIGVVLIGNREVYSKLL